MRLSCKLGTRAFSGACQNRSVGLQTAFQGKKCSLTIRICVSRWSLAARCCAGMLRPCRVLPLQAALSQESTDVNCSTSRILMLSRDSAACSDVSRPGNCKKEQNFLKEPGGLAEGQYQDHPCTCPVTGLSINTSISWESIAPCSALIHTQSQAPEGGRCVSTCSQQAGCAVRSDRCDHPCVET